MRDSRGTNDEKNNKEIAAVIAQWLGRTLPGKE
jgi:hypothetical protein